MKSKFNLCFYNLFSDKQLIKLSMFVNTIKYDQLYTPAKRHHIYSTDSLYEKIWLVLKLYILAAHFWKDGIIIAPGN